MNNRFFKTFAVMAVLVFAVAACRTSPMYNAQNIQFDKPLASTSAAGQAIKRAAQELNWRTTPKSDGQMIVRQNVRGKHEVELLVKYDNKKFTILYQSSENMKYDAEKGTIHSNYNSWVKNLENAILTEANHQS
jgi:hypothetical protein